jgi:ferredoxin--NADP+ reductase
VDGPEFDGHKVNFDEAMRRSAMYRDLEAKAKEALTNG